VLTDFARLLANDYAVSDALHDLVDGVTKVVGITGAGVSLVNGDRITFATAANEAVTVIERLQEGTQAGPCLDAHRSGQPVLVADVTDHSERWPALAQAAPAVGLVAVAGIPMQLNGTRLGALNLYHSARREWSDDEVNMARLLADMATGSVANASRLDKVRHTTAQLQVALDSRIIIEQAKGVLAGETNISVDEAFRVLRHHARNNNASLHSVADAVVNLGLRP
jgi:GAF domain-containing protein